MPVLFNFFFVNDAEAEEARVFVPSKLSQPSLIFVGSQESYSLRFNKIVLSPTNLSSLV